MSAPASCASASAWRIEAASPSWVGASTDRPLPSLDPLTERITACTRCPSRSASSRRRSTKTPPPSPGMKPSAAASKGVLPVALSALKRHAPTKNSGCMSAHTPPVSAQSAVRCRSACTAACTAAWVEAQAASTTKCAPFRSKRLAIRPAFRLPR